VDDGCVGENVLIREGVGLTNTRARLQQLYGPAQSVEISAGHGAGLRVTLSLPARQKATA